MSKIDRRDFINGSLLLFGSSVMPVGSSMGQNSKDPSNSSYPPALNGLRGSHPGSNESAHKKAWTGNNDWGRRNLLDEEYDLVVVGGGISGLASAYFFSQQHGSDKKILIIENHDDFGGHARRNEHIVDGKLILGEGGSESFEYPSGFSNVVLKLLDELGVDMEAFKSAYDRSFFKKHGLEAVTYFNERYFGEDKIVRHPFCDYPGFIEGLLRPKIDINEAVEQVPLNIEGKRQLLKLLMSDPTTLGVEKSQWRRYVREVSYFDYMRDALGVTDPLIHRMARQSIVDYGGVPDVMTINGALEGGALGMNAATWKEVLDDGAYQNYIDRKDGTYAVEEPFIEHYPDGNATIARMLVKKLIPNVGKGDNVEEIILSKFNYHQLDKKNSNVRLRLNSTAINIEHETDASNSDYVYTDYIKNETPYRVKSKNVILACYNMMIPHIVNNLPQDQYQELMKLTKIPLQYSTIGLRNWSAIKEAGIGMAMSPGNMHQAVNMDFPTSMGGYEYTNSPNDPCILHMRCCLQGDTHGAPAIQQFKEARYRMLGKKFSDYEAEIREHLTGMLPKNYFNFDRDVASITVNRWAHGYSYGKVSEIGIRPFGKIAIANSDASGSSLMNRAIEEAWRAVKELS